MREFSSGNKRSKNKEPARCFQFGNNWRRFLSTIDESKVIKAERSLKDLFGWNHLKEKTFLDIGSGSGLFSLAAIRLGAQEVYSFDADPFSVNCTRELKKKYYPDAKNWSIREGNILDPLFLKTLGKWDIVYAWGVLHHTGNMRQAFENVVPLVAESGQLMVSIYNHQKWVSRYWTVIKKLFNKNLMVRWLIILGHAPYLFLGRLIVRSLTGRLSLERGMSLWRDMLDWLGGFPFETAKPEQVFEFFQKQGFQLTGLRTVGGKQGCNEFVFTKNLPQL